jgi:Fur family transcriptional regulator, ferric uptake regulator
MRCCIKNETDRAAVGRDRLERGLLVFEDMGMRNTRQRRLIAERLESLAANSQDFTTDDLWHELRQADPQLGRATVFRAVEVLVQRGLLDRIVFPDGTHRYRLCGARSHHHHITCTDCRRIVEVRVCLPPEELQAVERSTGFHLEGHEVELFGRCAECRARAGEHD